MNFRFTLIHRASNTSLRTNEPDGWKQAVLKLARDKEFYSLIEFFDGSFIYYGDNGVINGGLHFIEGIEEVYGPDAEIEQLIEYTPDGITYEEIFNGQLDLSLGERMKNNKYRIPIIRDNFWAKFNSRWKTPVDLLAENDLDDEVIATPVDNISLNLTTQKIRYNGEYNWIESVTYPGEAFFSGLQLDWDETIIDDLKKFNLPRVQTNIGSVSGQAINLIGLFEAPFDGSYEFDIRIESSLFVSGPDEWLLGVTDVLYFVQRPDQVQQTNQFTNTIDTYGSDVIVVSTFLETIELRRGEQLAIYGDRTSTSDNITVFGNKRFQWKTDVDLATTIAITLSGEQTIDGVLTSASRVLVKNQGNAEENGIYVSGAGAWARSSDADTNSELLDAAVFVSAGDTHINTAWKQIEIEINIGISPIRWSYTIPSDERFKNYPGTQVDNHLIVRANTTYRETDSSGFLIHDSAAAIIKSYGLGVDNPFYSELLGSTLTNARVYENDGCAWKYAILKGLQLRGYELADKPFFMSFEQWWKGINPILCLGLTYDTLPASTTDPITSSVQDLADWDDAGGDFPGAWNYAVFSYPFTSVNGDGGVEGFTCGLWATTAGQTYVLTTVLEIFESGSFPVNITFVWAVLDASFNELVTEQFTYSSDGFKTEVFNITPPTNGTYLGVRVINDTVSDTKSLVVRVAIGETTEQLIVNSEFTSQSPWTNEGTGTDWTFASDRAAVSLASGLSKELTQVFTGGTGDFHFIGEYLTSGIGGGEQIDITVNFLDAGDNVVSTKTESAFLNQVQPWDHEFTSVVDVVKIQIIAEVISGTNIDLSTPFVGLYLIVPTPSFVTDEERVIRVEEREYFYDEEISVNISNIENITRKYDNDVIYNKVEIGYTQWQAEEISGIDDPQTKKIYSTPFKKIGDAVTIHSDFIAASLAIESTRRQGVEKSTDYKFDNNVFIVAINPDDVSPDAYIPELDENFTSILNLLNSDTRYNIRLSVARNFLRWKKWLNGCMQNYLGSVFKFVSAEGNFDMVTDMVNESPDCLNEDFAGESLSEKQNITITDDIIHTPNYYEFEVPLEWETYKTIRDNRRNAIGISQTDQNHQALFIDSIEYEPVQGKAKISGWTKEYFPIVVVEGPAATQECFASTECENPITDELLEILTDENGVCITE